MTSTLLSEITGRLLDVPRLVPWVWDDVLFTMLFALAAHAAGSRLLPRSKIGGLDQFFVSSVLGVGVLGSGAMTLGLLGWLSRPAVLAVAGALLVLDVRSYIREDIRAVMARILTWRNGVFAAVFIVLLAPSFYLSLYPPTTWDTTIYHFAHARDYAMTHRIDAVIEPRLGEMPQLAEMLFSLAFLFTGEIGASMIQVVMLGLIGGLLFIWGRERWHESAGILAFALFMSSPIVVWLGSSGYVDIQLTLFSLAAALAFQRWTSSREAWWLTLSGAMCGFAGATKLTGLAIPAIIGCLILCYSMAARGGGKLKRLVGYAMAFGLPAVLLLTPWFARSYFFAGNPVSPFLSNIFGNSAYIPSDVELIVNDVGSTYGVKRDFVSFLTLPVSLSKNQAVFFAELPINTMITWSLPVLMAYGLIAAPVAAAIAFLYLVFWFLSTQIARYLVPVMPLFCLLLAGMVVQAISLLAPLKRLLNRRVALAIMAVLLMIPSLRYAYVQARAQGKVPTSLAARDRYLERVVGYPSISYLNGSKGTGYSVYTLFGERLAYYANGIIKGDWFGPSRYGRVLDESGDRVKNGKELYAELTRIGSSHFLFVAGRHRATLTWDEYFDKHMRLVYARSSEMLFELSAAAIRQEAGRQLLDDAGFEQPAMGVWQRYGDTRVGTARVVVSGSSEESGVFQEVLVKPGVLYVFSVQALADEPGLEGKLQVNWLDSRGALLETSDVHYFRPEVLWKETKLFVSAPAGAIKAEVHLCAELGNTVQYRDAKFAEFVSSILGADR